LKGYDKLTESWKQKHARENIIKIKWDNKENRLEVYFKWNHPKKNYLKVYYDNGEWYHLAPGEMFKF
jgi:hypothetical protein